MTIITITLMALITITILEIITKFAKLATLARKYFIFLSK